MSNPNDTRQPGDVGLWGHNRTSGLWEHQRSGTAEALKGWLPHFPPDEKYDEFVISRNKPQPKTRFDKPLRPAPKLAFADRQVNYNKGRPENLVGTYVTWTIGGKRIEGLVEKMEYMGRGYTLTVKLQDGTTTAVSAGAVKVV